MADKYGIPPGGNKYGPWTARRWQNRTHTLSYKELVASVALGGWPKQLWAEAVATAAAESGRNPFIYNTFKKGHFGLFQISRSAHPEFFEPAGEGMAWVTPWANAQEAYRIYKSQGWGAWEAHSKGLYLAHLAQARAAVSAVSKGGTGTAYWNSLFTDKSRQQIAEAVVGGAANQIVGGVADGIADAAGATAEGTVAAGDATADTIGDMAQVVTGLWEAVTTPAFWMRVAYGATGVVLVAGGLFLMVRNTVVDQALRKAGAAIPKGKS